jgi:hypothetical protein
LFTFTHLTGTKPRPARCLGWDSDLNVGKLPIISVVEVDPLIQSVVEETLTDGGFEIAIASSGENAIDLLDVQKVSTSP